jgi:hypothetical protein
MQDPPIDEEPLVAIAARRALERLRAQAATPEFGRLLWLQATGAAGDTLVAIALAGSLFFFVPPATARTRVLLYLALTMAPFALVAPLLARYLDRHRAGLKLAMVASALGRGTLAWLLATRLDRGLWLFPIAFGILLLSRAGQIVRGALLPHLAPQDRTLLAANATVTRISALAGFVAALPGLALARWLGVGAELLLCASVYYLGALPALLLPAGRGLRPQQERAGARSAARSVHVRQAVVLAAGVRALVGFLVFHLAFSFRREDLGTLGLGFLVGAAALGGLCGALLAPKLRRRLKEEGILVAGALVGGLAALLAGRWFSLVSAGGLVLAFGAAAGAAKLAFDAIVQRETPEAARGWAFARYESILQLCWVAGALVPVAVALPGGVGVVGAGLAANLLALLYVLGRHRVALR